MNATVIAHKFKSFTGAYAITIEESGANLPEELKPWELFGTINVSPDNQALIGANLSQTELYNVLEQEGFVLLDAGISFKGADE